MCRAEVLDTELVQVRLLDDAADSSSALPRSVASWLASIGPTFVQYEPALRNAGFDQPIFLPGIRVGDLQELQVPGPDAERILQAVERLKQSDDAQHPQAPQQQELPGKDKEEMEDDTAAAQEDDGGAAPMQIEAVVDEEKLFFNKQKDVPPSTKLSVLVHLLESIVATEPESKVLVFSQFTTFLDLIEACLVRSDTLGAAFCRLDGKMKLSDRSNEIESFKSDPVSFLFLLPLFVSHLCRFSASAFSCCRSRWPRWVSI